MRVFSEVAVLASTKTRIAASTTYQRSAWRLLTGACEWVAQFVASRGDLRQRLQDTEIALAEALETGQRREKFVAILAHDLRNSLQSIGFGAELLTEIRLDAKATRHIESIRLSCGRMKELIETVLDLACSRLNGGIPVCLKNDDCLAVELRHVVEEVRSAHKDRTLIVDMDIDQAVVCDRRRLGQLLGNLLTNAVTHGEPDVAVIVSARADAHALELSVSNGTAERTPVIVDGLFRPFRNTVSSPKVCRTGLGLGLYIAAEIAASHGGTLQMTIPVERKICFTFRMSSLTQLPSDQKPRA